MNSFYITAVAEDTDSNSHSECGTYLSKSSYWQTVNRERHCHFVTVCTLLNNHFALMRRGKRTEARHVLKAAIYIHLLNFQRHTQTFFAFVFSLLMPVHHFFFFFFFSLIISGETRRTGFDNDEWPSMWVSSSQVFIDNSSPLSLFLSLSLSVSWLGSWLVATRIVPRNLIVLTRLGWGQGLQRPMVIITQG